MSLVLLSTRIDFFYLNVTFKSTCERQINIRLLEVSLPVYDVRLSYNGITGPEYLNTIEVFKS